MMAWGRARSALIIHTIGWPCLSTTSATASHHASRMLPRDPPAIEFLGGDAVGCAATKRRFRHGQPSGQVAADRNSVTPRTELVEREHRALQRPTTTRLPARMFGVVVGEACAHPEPHRRAV